MLPSFSLFSWNSLTISRSVTLSSFSEFLLKSFEMLENSWIFLELMCEIIFHNNHIQLCKLISIPLNISPSEYRLDNLGTLGVERDEFVSLGLIDDKGFIKSCFDTVAYFHIPFFEWLTYRLDLCLECDLSRRSDEPWS